MQLWALGALVLGVRAGEQPLSAAPLTRTADPSSPQNVVFGGPKEPDDGRVACAGLRLPDTMYSSPQTTSGFARTGFWETTDGAALAAWSQTAYGQETGVLVTVDSRILARVEASQLDPQGRERVDGMDTVLEARDCDGELMFEIHELMTPGAPLEVYDREGKLVAKGHQGSLHPDEFYWQDAEDHVLCTAKHARVSNDVNIFGGIEHFSFAWETGIAALSKHVLYAPQNRWVLLAATQVREIRNADRDIDGSVLPGPVSFWLVSWFVLKWVLLLVATYGAMHLIYLWVYFPEDLGLDPVTMALPRFGKKTPAPDYGTVPDAKRWWQGVWQNLP